MDWWLLPPLLTNRTHLCLWLARVGYLDRTKVASELAPTAHNRASLLGTSQCGNEPIINEQPSILEVITI